MDDFFRDLASGGVIPIPQSANTVMPSVGTGGVVPTPVPGGAKLPTTNPAALPDKAWNPNTNQTPVAQIANSKLNSYGNQAQVNRESSGEANTLGSLASAISDAAQPQQDPDAGYQRPQEPVQKANKSTGPDEKSVLPLLLKLLAGGTEAASGYFQGKAGNYNPTYTQQRLEREQAQKIQQNQFQQELAVAKVNYQYQAAMAQLNNEFSIKLAGAQGDIQRQNVINEYQQRMQLMKASYNEALNTQVKGFNILRTGSKSPEQAAVSAAPTMGENLNVWNATRPSVGGF